MADTSPAPPASWLTTVLQNHVAVAALAATLGAGVQPVLTWVEAWRKDVRVSELALAKEADSLWRRNLNCLIQGSSWEVDGPRKLTIKVTICADTGDALLRYFSEEWTATYRWVRAPETGERPPHAPAAPAAAPGRRLPPDAH